MNLNLTKQFTNCITVLTFSSISIVQAQVDTLWTKTFGGMYSDFGYSVQQTADEGYIVTGEKYSSATGDDVWLIKTTTSGDTLWTRAFGDLGSDYGNSVQQTADEGYIVTGGKHRPGGQGSDVWLIKTDADGDTLWTKTFWGYYSVNVGQSVQQTEDEGYIIVGYTEAWDYTNTDVLLIKTNNSGDTLWTKMLGGSGKEYGHSIQPTIDEGYIITGSTSSFGTGGNDVWLLKTNADGDTLWTKTFGGNSQDYGYFVQQTIDEGYIITGSTASYGAGSHDIWLIKTNALGDTLWTKTFGGKSADCGYSVRQTLDQGYIITGYTSSFPAGVRDAWLIKTNASGDKLWTKSYGGSDNDDGYSIQQTSDEGYIITGCTSSLGSGDYDVWLIKTSSDVNPVYEDNIGITLDYDLTQNYPNPFNPTTTIEFSLPKPEFITLTIFNLLGQQVVSLVSDKLNPGIHKYQWQADNLPSGIYYCRLHAGEFEQMRKMILLK